MSLTMSLVIFYEDPAIATLQMEEEDLPFSSRYQPFPAATETNSDFCSLNLQTFQALKAKSNSK
jgi:hypothetical protein